MGHHLGKPGGGLNQPPILCEHTCSTFCRRLVKFTQVWTPTDCIASFPDLPHFICVHNNTQKQKSSEIRGRSKSIYHVNDIRWTWGGHGEEGPSTKTMHWTICANVLLQFWTPDISVVKKPLILTSKKVAFKLSSHDLILIPAFLRPPHVHSHNECFQAFPIFRCPPISLYHCECKWNVKMGGGLGMRLLITSCYQLIYSSPTQGNSTLTRSVNSCQGPSTYLVLSPLTFTSSPTFNNRNYMAIDS